MNIKSNVKHFVSYNNATNIISQRAERARPSTFTQGVGQELAEKIGPFAPLFTTAFLLL